jgi:hypothetical protein
MAQIKTASGRTKRVPAHVQIDTIVGLDEAGRVVVHEEWMGNHAFGLTLCCNAFDKGVEDGVVCRSCYSYEEHGNYLFQAPDGSWPGLDPMVELTVPH